MKFYEKHKTASTVITFVLFILMGACNFPIFNLNHRWSATLTCSIVLIGVSLYASLGTMEAAMLPQWYIWNILPLNLMLVLLGMGARYLLEYGEVSNTYNFTIPNMLLHIGVTVTLSTLSWFWGKCRQSQNAG